MLTVYVKLCGVSIPAGAVIRNWECLTTSMLSPGASAWETPWMASTPPAGSKSFSRALMDTEPLEGSSPRSFSGTGCRPEEFGSTTSTRMRPFALFGPSVIP